VTSRLLAFALLLVFCGALQAQPLPSWNDGPSKQQILKFVADVTTPGSSAFVPAEDRIAVFDNDGTLWAEQPLYFQFAFMLDQLKAAAPKHPEWKDNPAFKALVAKDEKALASMGMKPVLELLAVANTGMTVTQYEQQIRDWLKTARHPRFERALHRPRLQADAGTARAPAQQRLQDLHRLGRRHRVHARLGRAGLRHPARAGGGVGRRGPVRPRRRQAGADPPAEGRLRRRRSRQAGGHLPRHRQAADLRLRQLRRATGRCCCGLRRARGPRFMGLVHHTDAAREYAYDRVSKIGKLDKAWDDAVAKGWTVVDMKSEWNKIFAFE
jgi:hypothetical protein